MSEKQVIQQKLEYSFRDEQLLQAAIAAPGSAYDVPKQGNKRLALVGDAVLDLVVVQDWYESGADLQAGQRDKARLVSNKRLAYVARTWGLDEQVHVAPGQNEKKSGYQLATAVEALIGAVWRDTGGDFVRVTELIKHLYKCGAGAMPDAAQDDG